jgi:hypothetical protein
MIVGGIPTHASASALGAGTAATEGDSLLAQAMGPHYLGANGEHFFYGQ